MGRKTIRLLPKNKSLEKIKVKKGQLEKSISVDEEKKR